MNLIVSLTAIYVMYMYIMYIGKHVGPRGTFLARLLIASDTICHDMRSVLLVKITVVSYRMFIYNAGRDFVMYFIDTYKELCVACTYVLKYCNECICTTTTITTGTNNPNNNTNTSTSMRATNTAAQLTVSEKLLVTESNRLYRKNLLRSYIQPMKIGGDSVVRVYMYECMCVLVCVPVFV